MSEAHGVLHHHFDDMEQQRESTSLGMWAFLSTEVMMFGGLFFVYSYYRNLSHAEFVAGSYLLNLWLGFGNTLVLLASSFTMACAVHFSAKKMRLPMVWSMVATWCLGLTFLAIKAIEWTADWHEGLIPGLNWHPVQHKIPHEVFNALNMDHLQMYFSIYFCMTGLHAIHMIIGLGILAVWIWMGFKGLFTNGNDQPVEIFGLYWHFVDIVWVFLFPLLYLIGKPLGHH